jgi:hypothetical protein
MEPRRLPPLQVEADTNAAGRASGPSAPQAEPVRAPWKDSRRNRATLAAVLAGSALLAVGVAVGIVVGRRTSIAPPALASPALSSAPLQAATPAEAGVETFETALSATIAASHRWSVKTARTGHAAPYAMTCTTRANSFTCHDRCGINAGTMRASANDSKLALQFLQVCGHEKHITLDYDVASFTLTRFRLERTRDWQEWVLADR